MVMYEIKRGAELLETNIETLEEALWLASSLCTDEGCDSTKDKEKNFSDRKIKIITPEGKEI